jgi:hypothetical protein
MRFADEKLEISTKILWGEMLTEEEWHLAKGSDLILGSGTYEDWKRKHYEDDRIQGYLCICIENGKIAPKKHLIDFEASAEASKIGTKEPTIIMKECLVGVHREDVRPEFLREDQKDLW